METPLAGKVACADSVGLNTGKDAEAEIDA